MIPSELYIKIVQIAGMDGKVTINIAQKLEQASPHLENSDTDEALWKRFTKRAFPRNEHTPVETTVTHIVNKLGQLNQNPQLQAEVLQDILSTPVSPRLLKVLGKGAGGQTKIIKKISKGQIETSTSLSQGVAKRIVEKWKHTVSLPHEDADPVSCKSWKSLYHVLTTKQETRRREIGTKCRAMYKKVSREKKRKRVKKVTHKEYYSMAAPELAKKQRAQGGSKLSKLRVLVQKEQRRLWSGNHKK
jgi:hypothetical protein